MNDITEPYRLELEILERTANRAEKKMAPAKKVTEVWLIDHSSGLDRHLIKKNLHFPGSAYIIKAGLSPGERHVWIWEAASCMGDTEYYLNLYPVDPTDGKPIHVCCDDAMSEDSIFFDEEGRVVYSRCYRPFDHGGPHYYRYDVSKGERPTFVLSLPENRKLPTLRDCRQWRA